MMETHKINTLFERLERVKQNRALLNEGELDELSLSLLQLEDELSNLDEAGIAELAAAVDEDGQPIMTMEQTRAFVAEWRQRKAERPQSLQRMMDRALGITG